MMPPSACPDAPLPSVVPSCVPRRGVGCAACHPVASRQFVRAVLQELLASMQARLAELNKDLFAPLRGDQSLQAPCPKQTEAQQYPEYRLST